MIRRSLRIKSCKAILLMCLVFCNPVKLPFSARCVGLEYTIVNENRFNSFAQ